MNSYKSNLKYVLDNLFVLHELSDIKLEGYYVDDILIEEGQPIDSFLVLLSGKAKVIKNYENGKSLLLQFVNPINILGDVEYITKSNASCTVIATENIMCFKVKYSQVDEKYINNITFNNYLLKHLSIKLTNSSTRSFLNIIYPVKTRLASYILSTLNENHITEIASMNDLSDYIGTSYRHLNRNVNSLVELKIINKIKNKIEVLKFYQLVEIARGNIYEDNQYD